MQCQLLLSLFIGLLGFEENLAKREGPDTRTTFLGVGLDSNFRGGGEMYAFIPRDKLVRMHSRAHEFETGPAEVTTRSLESFLGLLTWASTVLWGTRHLLAEPYRLLKVALATRRAHVTLTAAARMDFASWRQLTQGASLAVELNRRPLTSAMCAWDASTSWGIGGHLGRDSFSVSYVKLFDGVTHGKPQPFWPRLDQPRGSGHINYLETFAGWFLLERWGERLRGCTVVCETDNRTAQSVFQKLTGTPTLMPLARQIVATCLKYDIRLSVHRIGTKENVLADLLSRGDARLFVSEWRRMRALEVVDVNDWQFSPDFFAELDAEFGPCSRDACCDSFKSNAFCPVSWNKSDNALLQDWRTLLVWCNGPFDLLFELLTVFLRAKWRQPVATSALFVVPVWAERPFYALLLRAGSAGVMRRVRSYPLGTQLFTKPVSRLEGGGRLAVRGAPWPVEVWFAPPTVPASRPLGVHTL